MKLVRCRRASPREMFWITRIILKSLKVRLVPHCPWYMAAASCWPVPHCPSASDSLAEQPHSSHMSLQHHHQHHCGLAQAGLGELQLLRDYHPDTMQLYSMNMDLQACLKELTDPAKRILRRVRYLPCWPGVAQGGSNRDFQLDSFHVS